MVDILVSFIIPHKGREQYLKRTLESIANQEFDLNLIEVTIISQNDQLSPHITAYSDHLNLKIYLRPATDTISSLRNFGVSQTSGIYLAFLDADVALSSNWLHSLVAGLRNHPKRALISAAQTCSDHASTLEQIRTALSNVVTDQNVNFLPGRNLLLSRETFNQVGGFPEHLITCEDYYFTDQVGNIGDLYYTSDSTYVHLGEDKDFGEMYRKEIWRGQSNLQSIRGRTIPLREIPSLIIPIGVLVLAVVFVITLLNGYFLLAGISLLLSLFPVVVYSIRLYHLTPKKTRFFDVVKFYLYYFPARAIGTLGGIFKTLSTSSHSK